MNWWQYLLLVNVYLVLFYGFYAALLRKETFFQLNRIYLVSAAALSFFIPMMQAGWMRNLFITREVHYAVYGQQITISQLKPVADVPVTLGELLAYFYFMGVLFLIGRLIWQLVVLNRIIKTDQQGVAYSFFKTIKVGETNNAVINAHEQVHAREWHSADVFIIEAVMIINWFNPVVYFYRRAIKHIHEFIADSHAIKVADNRADYALLLLTQTFETPTHNLVSHFFNHSLLKQRIIMLQKNKSERVKLLKYGLSAPLFVLMLVLSSATATNSKTIKAINNKITQVLLLPPPPISSITKLSAESSNSEPATMKILAKTQEQTAETLTTTDVTDTVIKSDSQVFAAVEIQPEFIGGQQKFSEFIAEYIKYPQDMIANNISGKAIVTFIVEPDGSLSNIKVLKAPTESAGDEARRVIALSPKWSRGIQNGRNVRVQFTVPVTFALQSKVDGMAVNAAPSERTFGFQHHYQAGTQDLEPAKFSLGGKNQNSMVQGVAFDSPLPDTSLKATNISPNKGKSGTEPLYILDGKEITSEDFKSVNPSDIESINVLRGKSTTALYGSKGANGVIVIKLKSKASKTVTN